MFKRFPSIIFIVLLSLSSSLSWAQNDIFTRFGGVYSVEHGPHQVQFVLYPKGHELKGNIVYGGRDYPLSLTVDGLTLKGVFGQDINRQFFRMPLSSNSRFEVTFAGEHAEDGYGVWSFIRLPLPEFSGQFSGEFGRITLQESGPGIVNGHYRERPLSEPVVVEGIAEGLETILQGDVQGKLFYSFEEGRYYAQVNGHFSAAAHKSTEVLAQERRNRIRRDNNAWRRALARGTEEALEDYRQDWPNGRHIDKIEAVKEQIHWQQVETAGGFNDYLRHFERFPQGQFALEADDRAWRMTEQDNTDKSYSRYMKAFAQGRHVAEANTGKANLAWRRAGIEHTISGYGDFANQFAIEPFVQKADEAAWDIATKTQSITAFNAYQRAFPSGMHVAKVDSAKANVERILADNKAYRTARERDTKAGYNAYLAQYPEGRHVTNAHAGIAAIESAIIAQKDDEAWRQALAAQTESAIDFYAINYPDGRHVDEVGDALRRLKQLEHNRIDSSAFAKAQKANTLSAYQGYLSRYHDGLHRQQAQNAVDSIVARSNAKKAKMVKLQNQLFDLGHLKSAPSGTLDNQTKLAIKSFQSNQKLAVTGKVNHLLIQQLNEVEGFQQNQQKAKEGSVSHMYALANNLFYGIGTKADVKASIGWYKKAAEEGNPQAMGKLAEHLLTGKGGNKDPKQALRWLKKSIRLGDTNGMYQMGLVYLNGTGVRQNPKKALGWLERAAQSGSIQAMNHLGDIYAEGRGVKKDAEKAKHWYDKAGQ